MMETTIYDLPHDLVGEKILSKVPITSLREVRSTCKLWHGLLKDHIMGKEAANQHQFLGFVTKDDKVCSLRFHLRRWDEEVSSVYLDDLSIKRVDLFKQVEISKVFHCDGLVLCVVKDKSKLVAWNPYLGQTRSISPLTYFHSLDCFLFGYDMNRNHKILRFHNKYSFLKRSKYTSEIYDFSSDSWKVLEVTPDWLITTNHRGVSFKGNSYFWAHDEKMAHGKDDKETFILCFDFTRERFGPRLPLPFQFSEINVTLSSVRDEKLALIHENYAYGMKILKAFEIWITTKIEANDITWSKFLNVDMRPLIDECYFWFRDTHGSFFIDEEEKVAVVFDLDVNYHTAFIIGDDGYYRTVNLGEAPDPWDSKYTDRSCSPLGCSSSYLPSLVQLNKPHKR